MATLLVVVLLDIWRALSAGGSLLDYIYKRAESYNYKAASLVKLTAFSYEHESCCEAGLRSSGWGRSMV